MSKIVACIIHWINNPNAIQPKTPYFVCTKDRYTRPQQWEKIHGKDFPAEIPQQVRDDPMKPVYENPNVQFYPGFVVTREEADAAWQAMKQNLF